MDSVVCIINRNETTISNLHKEDIIIDKGTDTGRHIFELLKVTYGTPNSIYHLAASSSVANSYSDPYKSFVDTVDLTSILLEFIRTSLNINEVSFFITSSAAVYGNNYFGKINEECTPSPFSNYGYHKLMSELICINYARSYGIKLIVFRLFSVYGDELRKQLIWDLCNKIYSNYSNLNLSGIGNEVRDWIHVSDVVNLIIECSKFANENAQIINLGTGVGTTVKEIAQRVKDSFKSSVQIDFSGELRLGDPYSLVSDISMLNSLVSDYKFKKIDKGINEYVEWYLNSKRD